jgi:hypothetical protein
MAPELTPSTVSPIEVGSEWKNASGPDFRVGQVWVDETGQTLVQIQAQALNQTVRAKDVQLLEAAGEVERTD